MRFEDACIPVAAAWSSPFVRWQGPAADISSLDLAAQVTADALERTGIDWPLSDLVLGITVPQKESFYGAPTLATGSGSATRAARCSSQACATSVACVALGRREPGGRPRRRDARRRHRPHEQRPASRLPEHRRARRDARLRELGARQLRPRPGHRARRCSRRPSRSPARGGSRRPSSTTWRCGGTSSTSTRSPTTARSSASGWCRSSPAAGASRPRSRRTGACGRSCARSSRRSRPVQEGGVVSYGTQTHPADGCAGMVVTTRRELERAGYDGPVARIARHRHRAGGARARCRRRRCRRPARRSTTAGLGIEQVAVIKTHNPFAVNDVWLGRELGVDAVRAEPVRLQPRLRPPAGADRRARRSSS